MTTTEHLCASCGHRPRTLSEDCQHPSGEYHVPRDNTLVINCDGYADETSADEGALVDVPDDLYAEHVEALRMVAEGSTRLGVVFERLRSEARSAGDVLEAVDKLSSEILDSTKS